MNIIIVEVLDGFFGDVAPTAEEREELTGRYERQLVDNLQIDYPEAGIKVRWQQDGRSDVSVDSDDYETIETHVHQQREAVWAALW